MLGKKYSPTIIETKCIQSYIRSWDEATIKILLMDTEKI